MNTSNLQHEPVEGKTYTLFGTRDSTMEYFQTIASLADVVLEIEKDISILLKNIQDHSERRKYLRRILNGSPDSSLISKLLLKTTSKLEPYTEKVHEHLEHIPVTKLRDRRFRTTREQYHLYMLEIELTNRLFREQFITSDKKIALLPYCLQDFSTQCQAAPTDFDYQCKHCSSGCYQNFVSTILSKNGIEPYIWMGRSMRKLAKTTFKKGNSLGILGIACIPELTWGMRKCEKYGIPVLGLPLNANRCIRWWGEFYPNSVDLEELERLVTPCV
jgi:hypothetical protein